ncbi:HPF/RaiA family ribosome-associated protein [Jidongwangia harbinensis]|uniref:HPF/RaiA family ribosome-associated protein n=1 Tax=Jidongwangia harbinensis TaxID=2878561 RepID=UPI001CD924D4|nr:HPF/RaiA family ribosome-associated protein [Jidongwangia harbinensis]MCA2217737.1 HPF/RaiA family ribosome-associated protein [Jidongwangia harbinensis]
MTYLAELPVPRVRAHGRDAADCEQYAIDKVRDALRRVPGPVLEVQLLLESMSAGDWAVAHVDADGVMLHAHAMAPSVREAVDLMHERLHSQLRHLRRGSVAGG